MLLLIILALYFLYSALLFSVFSLPLKVHYSTSSSFDFCVSVSNSTLIRLPLFMALAIQSVFLFSSSSTSVDSPSTVVLGVPYSVSSSALRELPLVFLSTISYAWSVCFFSYVMDAFFPHHGSQMDSKSL